MRAFRNIGSVVISAALAGAVMTVGGCDTPESVAPRAINSGQELVNTLNEGKPQIDNALETLNALRYGPAADRNANYQAFSRALSDLGITAERARDESQRMRSLGNQYFDNWTRVASRESPEARREGAEARRMADDRFETITSFMTQLRRSYDNLENGLIEIHDGLRGNLTDQGLQSMDPIMANLGMEAANTKNLIDRLNEQIMDVINRRAGS